MPVLSLRRTGFSGGLRLAFGVSGHVFGSGVAFRAKTAEGLLPIPRQWETDFRQAKTRLTLDGISILPPSPADNLTPTPASAERFKRLVSDLVIVGRNHETVPAISVILERAKRFEEIVERPYAELPQAVRLEEIRRMISQPPRLGLLSAEEERMDRSSFKELFSDETDWGIACYVLQFTGNLHQAGLSMNIDRTKRPDDIFLKTYLDGCLTTDIHRVMSLLIEFHFLVESSPGQFQLHPRYLPQWRIMRYADREGDSPIEQPGEKKTATPEDTKELNERLATAMNILMEAQRELVREDYPVFWERLAAREGQTITDALLEIKGWGNIFVYEVPVQDLLRKDLDLALPDPGRREKAWKDPGSLFWEVFLWGIALRPFHQNGAPYVGMNTEERLGHIKKAWADYSVLEPPQRYIILREIFARWIKPYLPE